MKLSMRQSSRKSKKDVTVEPAEVATTPSKSPMVPRRGVLGKMGLKKKEKVSLIRPPQSKNVQQSIETDKSPEEEEPAPVEEEPVADAAAEPMDAPAKSETQDVEDTPMEEEPAKEEEEEEEEPVDEREEEEPTVEEKSVAMEPVDEQCEEAPSEAPVQEDQQSVAEERDQPEEPQSYLNTGLLCGCV